MEQQQVESSACEYWLRLVKQEIFSTPRRIIILHTERESAALTVKVESSGAYCTGKHNRYIDMHRACDRFRGLVHISQGKKMTMIAVPIMWISWTGTSGKGIIGFNCSTLTLLYEGKMSTKGV